MWKKLIIAFIILIAISGAIYGIYAYSAKASTTSNSVENLKEGTARRGDIKIGFSTDGTAALDVIRLRFQISGQLKELFFNIGDKVKKGDILAKLEDKDYANKLESAKVSYDQAVAKLSKTKQQYTLDLISSKSKLSDAKTQLTKNELKYLPMLQVLEAYSDQDIELAKNDYDNAKTVYESALQTYSLLSGGSKDISIDELGVDQSKVAVKTAEDNISDTILKAPSNGEIISISNNVGETVSNSSSSSSSSDFIVLSKTNKLSITAQVAELDLPNVEDKQVTEIEFEALKGQIFTGRVTSIDSVPVTDSTGIVTYTVNISTDKFIDKVKDGMTCTVSFIMKQKKNVIVIPNSAVKIVSGKQTVQVKDKDGNYSLKNIHTGLTDGTNVEVSEGLKEGDTFYIMDKK